MDEGTFSNFQGQTKSWPRTSHHVQLMYWRPDMHLAVREYVLGCQQDKHMQRNSLTQSNAIALPAHA